MNSGLSHHDLPPADRNAYLDRIGAQICKQNALSRATLSKPAAVEPNSCGEAVAGVFSIEFTGSL